MTVAELITELQRQPQQQPVRVLMHTVFDNRGDPVHQDEGDAIALEYVRINAGFVLLAGG